MNATELTLLQNAARAWNNEDDPGLDAAMEEIEIFLLERRTQPAQDQVAAVRAVPEGWKAVPPRPNHNMLDALYGHAWMDKSPAEQIGLIQAYRNMLDAATLKLPPVAAPSPQPELSGSIGTDAKFQLLLNDAYALATDAHACGNEFGTIGKLGAAEDLIFSHIDAWKDAACAVAREEGYRHGQFSAAVKIGKEQGHKLAQAWINGDPSIAPEYAALLQRATDAEAKLAEWSRVVEVSMAADYANRAIAAEAKLAAIQSELKEYVSASFYDVHGNDFYISDLSLWLTATPSQSDTSGLPG